MIWIILSGALFLGYVSCGDDYTLELSPTEAYASSNPLQMYLGKKIVLRATASFAAGKITSGVVIELLPSLMTTVFVLGDIIKYTKGSQLSTPDTTIDGANIEYNVTRHKGPEYDDTSLRQRFDTRAVFKIGEVTSSGAGATDADNQIIIEFEVVYIYTGGNPDGGKYDLFVCVEYDGGNYIWISVFTVILKNNAGTETEAATFDVGIGNDTNIELLIPKIVTLTMYIPRSVSQLTLDALVENDADANGFFVQYMNLKSVGEAYAFGTVKENIFTDGDGICSSSLRLFFGRMINKESKEASPNTTTYALDVEITLLVHNFDLVDEVVSVGFIATRNDYEVWVAVLDLTVTMFNGSQPPFTHFTAAGHPGEVSIPPNFTGRAEVALAVPRRSNHVYNITLRTEAVSATSNALSICSITPTTHDKNMCSIPHSAVNVFLGETGLDSVFNDKAVLVVNISNTGMQPTLSGESDLYRFDAYVMMMKTATEGETFHLIVDVNDTGTQTVEFTTGPAVNYTDDADHTFILTNDCLNNVHHVGSTLAFKMKVQTKRFATAGDITIEVPIPSNITQSHLKYMSAKVISKGKNVMCLSLFELPAVVTDWVENSGENDRAVITIPSVCNREIVDDVLEDQFIVEIKVTIKDVTALLDADTVEELGIGAKSGQNIWTSSYGFSTKTAVKYATTTRINGVIIANGEGPATWPGDLKVQWSDDNVKYYDYIYKFDAGTAANGGTTYALDPPLYARYVRLINTDGGICTDYDVDTFDISQHINFLGSNESAEILASRVMFILDDDVNTCMSLPAPNTTDTAKYYWANFDTSVLGADGNSSFNLQLTGNGLDCNSPAGPQVTMVMYPKDSTTLKFRGERNKCTVLEKTAGPPTTCKYECACSDAVTCADISLVLYHKNFIGGVYDLCDVKIVT